MSNLFQLTADFQELLLRMEQVAIDRETDEALVLSEMLSDAGLALDNKVDNIISYAKSLLIEAEALKNEAKNMTARAKAKEAKVEALKKYLLSAGVTKYESVAGVITTRKSEAVEVDEFAEIPEWATRTKMVTEVDKIAIKEQIKAGQPITFARLVVRESLGIK